MTAQPTWIVVRPSFPTTATEVIEPAIAASGMATVATPLFSGEKPRPVWSMTLSERTIPPIAPMKPTTSARPATYGRRASRDGFTSEVAPRAARRRCSRAKATSSPTPPASTPKLHAGQPSLWPRTSG